MWPRGLKGKVRDVVEAYLRGEIQGIVACEHHDHECGEEGTMKIAVSSTGKDLNCQIDPRFGRCQYFIFVDPETMEFEASENEGLMAWAVQACRPHNCCPKRSKSPDHWESRTQCSISPFWVRNKDIFSFEWNGKRSY